MLGGICAISIIDGKNIGKIIDVEINQDGSIKSLVAEKSKFLISMFTSNNEFEIKWDEIDKIGEDVILVRIDIS